MSERVAATAFKVGQNSGDQRLSRERGELETLKIKRSERFGVRPNAYAKRHLLNSATPELLPLTPSPKNQLQKMGVRKTAVV
jgi:hypothetical protein